MSRRVRFANSTTRFRIGCAILSVGCIKKTLTKESSRRANWSNCSFNASRTSNSQPRVRFRRLSLVTTQTRERRRCVAAPVICDGCRHSIARDMVFAQRIFTSGVPESRTESLEGVSTLAQPPNDPADQPLMTPAAPQGRVPEDAEAPSQTRSTQFEQLLAELDQDVEELHDTIHKIELLRCGTQYRDS